MGTLEWLSMVIYWFAGQHDIKQKMRQAAVSQCQGESFYFKINGVAMYMKGANYIPTNIIHTNTSNEYYYKLLDQALDSNMNMIRIWCEEKHKALLVFIIIIKWFSGSAFSLCILLSVLTCLLRAPMKHTSLKINAVATVRTERRMVTCAKKAYMTTLLSFVLACL